MDDHELAPQPVLHLEGRVKLGGGAVQGPTPYEHSKYSEGCPITEHAHFALWQGKGTRVAEPMDLGPPRLERALARALQETNQ